LINDNAINRIEHLIQVTDNDIKRFTAGWLADYYRAVLDGLTQALRIMKDELIEEDVDIES